MKFLFKQPDIAFSADDTHTFLPWLVGIMIGLTAFLLCLGLTINHWLIDRQTTYTNSFTVSIPADFAANEDITERVAVAVKEAVGNNPVTTIGDAELRELLSPWLGKSTSVSELPLPAVLDVTMEKDTPFDHAQLQKQLQSIAPGTEIDTQERWARSFAAFSSSVQYVSWMLATLVVSATVMMVAFTSRASLKLHARSVHLLHSIGAEDKYIAEQFQQEAFRLVLPAAAIACIGAGLIFWIVGSYIASLDIAVLPSLSLTVSHATMLVFMPALCACAAWIVARVTIRRQLEQTL